MEIQEADDESSSSESIAPIIVTVAIAVNSSKSSRCAVKWALEKFVPERRILFRLLHVRPKITMVPTPMGNYIPISNVREDVASAYKKEMEWRANAVLLPYKKMCSQKKVEAEAVIIEADDVADAISGEIAKFAISRLVIGASSRNIFTRKIKGPKTSSKISGRIPGFCTVYIVSKGKLSSVRTATSMVDESTEKANSSSISSYNSSHFSSSARSDGTVNFSLRNPPLPQQRSQALATINQNFARTRHNNPRDILGSYTDEGSMSSTTSYRSLETDDNLSLYSCQASASAVRTNSSSPQNQVDLNAELERLRIELKHVQNLCEVAQNESIDASQRLQELGLRRLEEELKLKQIELRGEKARYLARKERDEREAAKKEAELAKECAEREKAQRKDVEGCAAREVKEKLMLEKALDSNGEQYTRYTWEEIQLATSSFSSAFMIGRGANGTVYKGSFHHTIAAVKILHSNEGHGTKQLKQELEILSRIHHPYLLLLLGACPERGCLVYEFMENGSLDDRLQCKNNTPPLPWFYRFRIAWEVASAIAFLHNSKPEPIIHRDLKPANILLDHNFKSKIGDVGLSTLLPTVNYPMSTIIKDTAPVGTFCYIDPEYQRTGLVSPKSDTYALGMVILQLITAKPPMGLAYAVEIALENECLVNMLDPKGGQWPEEETQELARLGLSCAELRRKDRPDLNKQVLPMLERLKEIAEKAQNLSTIHLLSAPPNHFICPILQEVMDDPYVASDGYTYDRKAIEMWLSMNDKSPMTNLRLPNKNLIPNHSLRSAIEDWKSRKQ
ncbi:U-box domain-containing protein 35-like isoform X2 [Ananas comosus]|uniref:RING-type E3 ubiquitin transferase n=1 Tax=Ananas comosus TaxID=4615 RepID=A0A6P5HN38_ANACO|nr:U-box domain-containing protein 35-like isoform X2 [Ananas comosus]